MSVSWPMAITAAATVQWLAFAGVSAFSRTRFPRNGTMRRAEKLLLASTVVLAAGWAVQLDLRPLRTSKASAAAVAAAPASTGSCATLSEGMTAAQVRARMGEPDEVRDNAETRGDGAKTLVYRASRCAVHLFDDRVEFIE